MSKMLLSLSSEVGFLEMEDVCPITATCAVCALCEVDEHTHPVRTASAISPSAHVPRVLISTAQC